MARALLLRSLVLAQIRSAYVQGVEAFSVIAEVDISVGLPGFHLVGLGQTAVKEAGVRVRAALRQSGWKLPPRRVTVNLAPADVRKDGTAFDLPIAIGVLVAQGEVPIASVERTLFLGELGLDGSLRRVSGGLAIALHARQLELERVVLPRSCAQEAALVRGLDVVPADSLNEVVAYLRGERVPERIDCDCLVAEESSPLDLSDVQGQEHAKLALEVAAAGGHNLLLIGPPGAGKSMLAQRMAGILPPLDEQETFECTLVYSSAGKLDNRPRITTRPFRAPHHDVSVAGLIGGGPWVRPGEISLAHNGVLFLDELPEFRRNALEALRQPLEEGAVTLVRARASVRYPASFSLVSAMNPCPCGHYGSSLKSCVCDTPRIRAYRHRLSGPLLDRIDLHVVVSAMSFEALTFARKQESSFDVRTRVCAARQRQQRRFHAHGLSSNARIPTRALSTWCAISDEDSSWLAEVARKRALSARAIHRVLRVARTVADLAAPESDDDSLSGDHLRVALGLRALDEEIR